MSKDSARAYFKAIAHATIQAWQVSRDLPDQEPRSAQPLPSLRTKLSPEQKQKQWYTHDLPCPNAYRREGIWT